MCLISQKTLALRFMPSLTSNLTLKMKRRSSLEETPSTLMCSYWKLGRRKQLWKECTLTLWPVLKLTVISCLVAATTWPSSCGIWTTTLRSESSKVTHMQSRASWCFTMGTWSAAHTTTRYTSGTTSEQRLSTPWAEEKKSSSAWLTSRRTTPFTLEQMASLSLLLTSQRWLLQSQKPTLTRSSETERT